MSSAPGHEGTNHSSCALGLARAAAVGQRQPSALADVKRGRAAAARLIKSGFQGVRLLAESEDFSSRLTTRTLFLSQTHPQRVLGV
jgi:hypothetical protein